jgi:hypothetical protein
LNSFAALVRTADLEAIVLADWAGEVKGEVHKICANPAYPIHHPKKQQPNADASYKAQQDKERREQPIGYTTLTAATSSKRIMVHFTGRRRTSSTHSRSRMERSAPLAKDCA